MFKKMHGAYFYVEFGHVNYQAPLIVPAAGGYRVGGLDMPGASLAECRREVLAHVEHQRSCLS